MPDSSTQTILISLIVMIPIILYLVKKYGRMLAKLICIKIFTDNVFIDFLTSKFIQTVIPSFAAGYFLILDVWGSDWDIIKNNIPFHEKAFFFVLLGTFLLIVVKEASASINQRLAKINHEISEELSVLATKSVHSKLSRFKKATKSLSPADIIFEKITDSESQIELLLNEFETLINKVFLIKKSNICINIIHIENDNRTFYKESNQKGWNHTKASKIVNSQSAVANTLLTGQAQLFVSKQKASKDSLYMLSQRDKKFGDGSIFCYPVFHEFRDYKAQNIINVSTYGATLSETFDADRHDAIFEIFSDICRRIELELTLSKIKEWSKLNSVEAN
jgi:hypothetical protein